MSPRNRKRGGWLLAVGALTMGGILAYRTAHTEPDSTQGSALTSRMKTVCVGRILVDLPMDARVTLRKIRLDGFDMSAYLENRRDSIGWLPLRERELAARKNALRHMLMRARTRKLREGSRTINNVAGEEIGLKTTELNLSTGFSFAWQTAGRNDYALTPYMTLEMDSGLSSRASGKPVESSLGEDAMLTLWEKVSSSVRLRALHE